MILTPQSTLFTVKYLELDSDTNKPHTLITE